MLYGLDFTEPSLYLGINEK